MRQTAQLPPLLHWIAPRTAQKGLIANNPWLPAACTRAVALFSNEALHVPATVLAGVHEVAIDYISQAPVLVLAAAGKSDLALREHRERVAARFKVACSARPRLKQLMRFYGLSPQLRALSGDVLRPIHYRLLKPLSEIPSCRLAQSIPSALDEQIAWLATIEQWRTLALRETSDPAWIVAWAAANSCHRHSSPAAIEIIDFACGNRRGFDLGWSFAEAAAACDRWHATIARRSFKTSYSLEQLAAVADYGPLPVEAVIDDHVFIALRTRAQIFAEGRAMHHCVATYAERVHAGRSWLYSICRHGTRIATLELGHAAQRFALIQIKAHCNRRPPAETVAAALHFLAQINAAMALAPALPRHRSSSRGPGAPPFADGRLPRHERQDAGGGLRAP
jgi:hypothetical protein